VNKPVLAAAPLALGVLLMAATHSGGTDNPVLFLRIDLGTFASLLLVLVGLAAGAGLLLRQRAHRKGEAVVVEAQRQGQEMHRQFIRRLDHEMKNPLTAARAALANLNGSENGNGTALTSLHSQIDRLARLTTDLRKVTDLETRPVEMAPVDIGELLTELVEEVNQARESCGRPVQLHLPSLPWPLPHVTGDWDLIYLACHNVLNNALKFSGSDARVEVRAFEDGPSVAVEVADTGPGICPEDLPHIGEELYRGRTALGVEGSGLGMALVRAIAQRHGGALAVRSRLGKGTVVTLRLPATQG
jgi:two-component system, OmpR family, sensor kinase